jgi:hypothetical protein
MHIKASKRSAFITAIGLLTFFASDTRPATAACETTNCPIVLAQNTPPQAQTDAAATPDATADTEKKILRKSHHARKSHSGKLEKSSSKTPKNPDGDKSAERENGKSNDVQPAVSPSIANANAQMLVTAKNYHELVQPPSQKAVFADGVNSPVHDASKVTDQASTPNANAQNANVQIVASDQLNDLDRAAVDESPAPQIMQATIEQPYAEPTYARRSGADDSWNQASNIGKVFVAFGGFLTLASAARMFMA